MTMLVGYFFALIFLFQWQHIRQFMGFQPRMSFLDKVCIDQEDELRKSKGTASLGAFLSRSDNFVLMFSPEYFTRLWCCYEIAAFQKVRTEHQKIVFIPVAYPRVLFAAWLCWTGLCAGDPFMSLAASLLGCKPETFENYVMLPGLLLAMLVQVECQKLAAQRETIDEQIANFSIDNAECFDPKDRPRVYREIGKWFGEGDEAAGIANFNNYVRTELRSNMDDLVGDGACLSAVIPFSYAFLAGTAPIAEDIAIFGRLGFLAAWDDQLFNLMGALSCSMIATPIFLNIQLWTA